VLFTPIDGRPRTGAVVNLEEVVIGQLHLAELEGTFRVDDPNVMMFMKEHAVK
jgi:hypothetical protein